jgi:protein-S-isoprenylcysteine O-methyltransferase Ste14
MDFFELEKFSWLCTGTYWLVAAFGVKKTLARQTDFERIAYMCLWVIAFLLLLSDNISFPFLYRQVFIQNGSFKIAGFVICVSGLAFSVWARIVLGTNWSGRITIKKDHDLIQRGPYALTRNPIYTGFFLAFIGCTMTLGLLKGYLSLPFITVGIFLKIRKEEVYMHQVFSNRFVEYKQKVKRLLPFIY